MVRGGYLVEEASRSVTSTLVYQRSHGRLYCIVVRTSRLCDVHARQLTLHLPPSPANNSDLKLGGCQWDPTYLILISHLSPISHVDRQTER